MEYETPDGSQFSLREIWSAASSAREAHSEFAYTTISATVDGKAYFGRLDERVNDVDEGGVLSSLELVPPEAIYPVFEEGLTEAPMFDPSKHYLKAPSFTWDDCQHGVTFVADCTLNEIQVLEILKKHRHPNIVGYHGCVVTDGRITQISLQRCQSNIVEHLESCKDPPDIAKWIDEIKTGIDLLHSLGMAHNDINPGHVYIVEGRAVIIDFDSCLPFGHSLMKGCSVAHDGDSRPLSAAQNDEQGLRDLQASLAILVQSTTAPTPD